MFKKAIKKDAKLRLALCGPSGGGKTYTSLSIAAALGGKVAYVDTEHGSASKYADLFSFDVIEPNVFDPRELIKTIREAVKEGYSVICIDSLSHYWMGKGGELEIVDSTAKRSNSGNSFAAWKTVTPIHNELVDTIISAPIHVIATMRTKTEWVIDEVTDRDGKKKKVPRKVGMAPVMRDGIEYEFDVCGDLDQENNLTITKSRCSKLSGQVINRPGQDVADVLREWLSGEVVAEEPTKAEAPTGVAAERIQQETQRIESQSERGTVSDGSKPWSTKGQMVQLFEAMRGKVGNKTFIAALDVYGAKDAKDFKSPDDALKCYRELQQVLETAAAA